MLAKAISREIRERRLRAGLSQARLAELTTELGGRGLDIKAISRLECGHVVPSLRTLEVLAKALKCPVGELLAEPKRRSHENVELMPLQAPERRLLALAKGLTKKQIRLVIQMCAELSEANRRS